MTADERRGVDEKTNLSALIDRALKLDGKANPPPWRPDDYHPADPKSQYIRAPNPERPGGDHNLADDVSPEDAALISEYRTIAPTLARALKELIEACEPFERAASRIKQTGAIPIVRQSDLDRLAAFLQGMRGETK